MPLLNAGRLMSELPAATLRSITPYTPLVASPVSVPDAWILFTSPAMVMVPENCSVAELPDPAKAMLPSSTTAPSSSDNSA